MALKSRSYLFHNDINNLDKSSSSLYHFCFISRTKMDLGLRCTIYQENISTYWHSDRSTFPNSKVMFCLFKICNMFH